MGWKHLLPILVLSVIFHMSNCGTISPTLMAKLSNRGRGINKVKTGDHDVILDLPSVFTKAMSSPVLKMEARGRSMKVSSVTNELKKTAHESQAPFMELLEEMGLADIATPCWITNKIILKHANLSTLQALADLPGTFTIREPLIMKINPVTYSKKSAKNVKINADSVQWGVQKIDAPAVWSKGFNGKGVLVANIDTGVNGNHESLKSNYGGKWKDATDERDKTPKDRNGHGTHVMGTMCGTTKGIGVAPGAKWIACKGLDGDGNGYENWLIECGQWLMEQKPMPKIINNSWGGGQGSSSYDDMIRAWKAAGIVGVFAIGNEGSRCKTASSPGDSKLAWSVGSTNEDDTLSRFSSRGPSVKGLLKPEVSAPGGQIYSASHSSNTGYMTISGTSMAAPHVSGAVALLLQANPNLSVDQVFKKMQDNTDKLPVSSADQKCTKGSDGETYPNNSFGNGRINIKKAMGL